MPNWTHNTIRISGKPADIRAFLEAVKWEDALFDFNRLIPMPAILRQTCSGSRHFDGVLHETWFVENPEASYSTRVERPFNCEEKAVLAEIGYSSWYSWCVEHWGTKWNACDVTVSGPAAIEAGHAEIRFDTAWSMPGPIQQKVFGMFPQLAISWIWSDEDDGYARSYRIERGPLLADGGVAA